MGKKNKSEGDSSYEKDHLAKGVDTYVSGQQFASMLADVEQVNARISASTVRTQNETQQYKRSLIWATALGIIVFIGSNLIINYRIKMVKLDHFHAQELQKTMDRKSDVIDQARMGVAQMLSIISNRDMTCDGQDKTALDAANTDFLKGRFVLEDAVFASTGVLDKGLIDQLETIRRELSLSDVCDKHMPTADHLKQWMQAFSQSADVVIGKDQKKIDYLQRRRWFMWF